MPFLQVSPKLLKKTQRNVLTEFNSNNTRLLTLEETKAKIASLAYIQEEMAKDGKQ